MEPERRLALYRSPVGAIALIVIALSFVAIGALILLIARPLPQGDVIMAWFTIAFFGLGAVVLAVGLRAERRTPLLQVTDEGVMCHYTRFPLDIMGWGDVQALVVYQKPWSRKPKEPVYYLAILAHAPEALRDPEKDESVEWPVAPDLPDEERMAMLVPLADVFFNTPAPELIRARTLGRIQTAFAPEIARYGVTIAGAIQEQEPANRA